MSGKSTCKWCGAKATVLHRNIFSDCGTWICTSSHAVSRSARCERDELRRRVNAAVKALQGMTRCEIEPDDQFGIVAERNEHGEWVEWDDVEDVIEILRGNSPTNKEKTS